MHCLTRQARAHLGERRGQPGQALGAVVDLEQRLLELEGQRQAFGEARAVV